jgi:hypothetical protein
MRLAKEKEAKRLAEEAAKAAKAAEAAAAKAAAADSKTPQSDAADTSDSTRARGPSLLAQMPKKPANANGGGADAIVDNVFGSLHHADTSSIIDEIRRRRGQQVRPRERVRERRVVFR